MKICPNCQIEFKEIREGSVAYKLQATESEVEE